jgi:hypothetical protein
MPTIKTQAYFTGNPIVVEIPAAADSATPRSKYRYRVKVYVPIAPGSDTFVVIGEKTAAEKPPYTINGIVFREGAKIDISDILDAVIDITPPDIEESNNLGGSKVRLTTNSTIFYYETDVPTLATVPVLSGNRIAIKGQLSKRQFALWRDSFFTGSRAEVLTHRQINYQHPLGGGVYQGQIAKDVFAGQPEYLSVINNFFPSNTSIEAVINVYPLSGAVGPAVGPISIAIANAPNWGDVYRFAVGPAQIDWTAFYAFGFSVVKYYTIYLTNGTWTSPLYRFNNGDFNSKSHFTPRYLVFQNSLGCYDTLVCTGQSIETAKIETVTVDKVTEGYAFPSVAELETVAKNGVHEIEINTGYYQWEDTNYLLELFYSKDIRLVTQEGQVPIQLINETHKYNDEADFMPSATLNFRFSNKEIAGSFLPAAVVAPARPQEWQGVQPFCMIADTGLRTGLMKFAKLELHYADGAKEAVLGAQLKANTEGSVGYIAPQPSPSCVVGTAAFTNTIFTMTGTYKKNTCVMPQIGDFATITITAGTYGGDTLAKANQRAKDAAILLDTQDYANTGAGAAACITGPWAYAMGGIPTNQFNLRWGQRVQNSLTGIAAGPGYSSGAPGDLIYGNYWTVFQSTNPSSIYYASPLFDNLLPTAPGGTGVYYLIVHTAVIKTVNIYKNGTLVITNNITLLDLGTNNYKTIPLTGMTYTTGDRYYIDII